jgi:2-oxoglutarate/2-oxoacid ferredoxin oxidoreductase subunit beta
MRPISTTSTPAEPATLRILFLGSAGQRISTAAEILCLAAMHGGLYATQKNDYPITVLRGHSISEVIISPLPIGFTGIKTPDIILALSEEGVARRQETIGSAAPSSLILQVSEIDIPDTEARLLKVDCTALQAPKNQRALALLAVLTTAQLTVSAELLRRGLEHKFKGDQLEEALALVQRARSPAGQ